MTNVTNFSRNFSIPSFLSDTKIDPTGKYVITVRTVIYLINILADLS